MQVLYREYTKPSHSPQRTSRATAHAHDYSGGARSATDLGYGMARVPAGLEEFGECVPILRNSKMRQPLQFQEQLHGFLSVVQSQTTREFQAVPVYMVYPPGPCPEILCGAHRLLEAWDGERELVKEHNFELYRIVRIATAGTLEHGIYARLTYLMLPSAYPSHCNSV